MDADLIVAGGGPVGLAVAIQTAQRGLAPLVLESRTHPLDKACGEGIMPSGVAALKAMGVAIDPDASRPFEGVRYVWGDTIAEARFAQREGLGVRRTALASALHRRAVELGVECRFGCRARDYREAGQGGGAAVEVETSAGPLRGRTLVAADGLHSPLRRCAGLAKSSPGHARFGVRRHYKLAPWSRWVEVHWSDAAEAYVTPVGPEMVGVAVLCRVDAANSGEFDALLTRFPALMHRLDGVSPSGEDLGAAHFRQRVRARQRGRLVLAGDAAGFVDPLTGEGLSLGFRSARVLADVLARGASLVEYERRARALAFNYTLLADLLLSATARPRLRRRVVAMLAEAPDLFARFLAINAGDAPVASLGVRGVARAVGGLLRAPRRGDLCTAERPRPSKRSS